MGRSDDTRKKLELENKELKKRVKELEKIIQNQGRKSGGTKSKRMPSPISLRRKKNDGGQTKNEEMLEICSDISREEKLDSADNFYNYIFKTIKLSSFYRLCRRITLIMRRIKLIRIIVAVVSVILLMLQTGTVIIVYTLTGILMLPFAVLIAASVPIISAVRSKKSNKYMKNAIGDKNVYVFYPLRNSEFEDSKFFKGNIADLVSNPDNAVIIVYPYYLRRPKGFKKVDLNIRVNAECSRVTVIKKYYYFIFFKKVLKNIDSKVNLIY